MALVDDFFSKLLGLFGGDAEQIKCATSVPVLLCSESGTQFNDARADGLSLQAFLGTLTQDVLQLFSVVRAEEHIQLAETRADAGRGNR